MGNLNKVMLIGNLTRDPELRYTPKGTAVADLGLAINRFWSNEQGQRQEETTYVDVTLWARQAEVAEKYLSKGRAVYIEGRLQMDTWEDKNTGQRRTRIKVNAVRVQLLDWDEENAGSSTAGTGDQSGGYEKEEDLAF